MKTRWIIILGILIILIIAMEIYYFTKNQLSSIVFNGSIKVEELIQEGKLIIPQDSETICVNGSEQIIPINTSSGPYTFKIER